MTELDWADVAGDELTASALHEVLALRNRVFVVEQECAYQDIDGLDLSPVTRHLTAASGGEVVAYARLLGPSPNPGQSPGPSPSPVRIGRVIVASSVRGRRLGHQLMVQALDSCATHWPDAPITLAAQAHLQEFYARHGFVAVGAPYDEDGIPHIEMAHRPA